MPPLLLAIETATSASSVALLRGGDLLDELRAPAGPAAATLLPSIDAILRRSDWTIETIEAFAVSVGPGSFTSLRVGIATIKGLAFGTDRPVVPVPTLTALSRVAESPAPDAMVVPMLDARRGEVYAAAFRAADGAQVVAPGVYRPEELAERLTPPCVLVGEAVPLCGDALVAPLGGEVDRIPPPEGDACARHVGTLGAEMLARGEQVAAARLTPRYLRRAEAEVKRTGSRFETIG